MLALIIADDDVASRIKLSKILTEAGYDVIATRSAAQTIEVILKNVAKVLILGGRIDGVAAQDLLPVLKSVSSKIKVILASEEISAPTLRRLRDEGIFYHFLKPVVTEDRDELSTIVACAFKKLAPSPLPESPGALLGPGAEAAGPFPVPGGKERLP